MTESFDRAPLAPSRPSRLIPSLWGLGLLLLAVLAGGLLVRRIGAERRAAVARHQARMETTDAPPVPGAAEVRVGVYLERIVQLSVKETSWTADFMLWFLGPGKESNLGESFRVVDGEVEQKEKVREEVLPDGRTYVLYRVRAKVTKFFDVTRFPVDDHLLTLAIEDGARDPGALRLVPDADHSGRSSRVQVAGYTLGNPAMSVKTHVYRTSQGDPRLSKGHTASRSQFIYGLPIRRDGPGFYFKLFQGLFAAVAIAFLVFFVNPSQGEIRFGLGVGAFFAAIANCYITASQLPDTGVMSLGDSINGLGLGAIFLSLVETALVYHLCESGGREALAKRLDRVTLGVGVLAYAGVNVLVYRAALG